jgi:hypothetical protein
MVLLSSRSYQPPLVVSAAVLLLDTISQVGYESGDQFSDKLSTSVKYSCVWGLVSWLSCCKRLQQKQRVNWLVLGMAQGAVVAYFIP